MSSQQIPPVEHFLKVDWRETIGSHFFTVDVPGIGSADLGVFIRDIDAEDADAKAILKITGVRASRTFTRRFTLEKDALTKDAEAILEYGVLTIKVPKLECVRSSDPGGHPFDVTVTPSGLIYQVDVPGLRTLDVKVAVGEIQGGDDDGPAVKQQRLLVSGWKTSGPAMEVWHLHERVAGSFQYDITFPSGIHAKTNDLIYGVDNGRLSIFVRKDPSIVVSTAAPPPPPAYRDAVDPANDADPFVMRRLHISCW